MLSDEEKKEETLDQESRLLSQSGSFAIHPQYSLSDDHPHCANVPLRTDVENQLNVHHHESPTSSGLSSGSSASSQNHHLVHSARSALLQFIPRTVSDNLPFLSESNDTHLIDGSQEPSSAGMEGTYYCHICFSNQALKEGHTLINCQHRFCLDCLSGYWVNLVDSQGKVNLKCFHPVNECENGDIGDNDNDNDNQDGQHQHQQQQQHQQQSTKVCGQQIAESDIQQVLKQSHPRIYDKLVRLRKNISNPHNRECPFCNTIQLGSESDPIMKCVECNELFCYFHSSAHSPHESCESYDLRKLKEDELNRQCISSDAKPCPQCSYITEKKSGCNHMRCPYCDANWCFICGQLLKETGDIVLPAHYRDPNSTCFRRQFEGSDMSEDLREVPMVILILLLLFVMVLGIPMLIVSGLLGLLVFPLAWYGRCCLIRSEPTMMINVEDIPEIQQNQQLQNEHQNDDDENDIEQQQQQQQQQQHQQEQNQQESVMVVQPESLAIPQRVDDIEQVSRDVRNEVRSLTDESDNNDEDSVEMAERPRLWDVIATTWVILMLVACLLLIILPIMLARAVYSAFIWGFHTCRDLIVSQPENMDNNTTNIDAH